GRTRNVLSSLIGDELIEIGVGVHAPQALRALADADVGEIARGEVGVERLDRAAQLARGLGGRGAALGRPARRAARARARRGVAWPRRRPCRGRHRMARSGWPRRLRPARAAKRPSTQGTDGYRSDNPARRPTGGRAYVIL